MDNNYKYDFFICYSKKDQEFAINLYENLKRHTIRPWIDCKDIPAGQNWEKTINQAINDSSLFLLLLSKDSLSQKGFLHKELKLAKSILDEHPDTDSFIIPVKIEECEIKDEKLRSIQWVDMFNCYNDGLLKIIGAYDSKNGINHTDNLPILRYLSHLALEPIQVVRMSLDHAINAKDINEIKKSFSQANNILSLLSLNFMSLIIQDRVKNSFKKENINISNLLLDSLKRYDEMIDHKVKLTLPPFDILVESVEYVFIHVIDCIISTLTNPLFLNSNKSNVELVLKKNKKLKIVINNDNAELPKNVKEFFMRPLSTKSFAPSSVFSLGICRIIAQKIDFNLVLTNNTNIGTTFELIMI